MGAGLLAGVLVLASSLGSAESSHARVSAQKAPGRGALTVEQLAAGVIDSDPTRAWPAMSELRRWQPADPKERKAMQLACSNWAAEFSASKDDDVRVLRAHALGALHELGLPAAAALSTACAKDAPAKVRLACALALAEMGEGAYKAIAKGVEPASLVGGALSCAAFARPGSRSAAALNALREAAGNTDTFQGILLSEPALVTLEILEQDVAKQLEHRRDDWDKVATPLMGGLNWGGIVEEKPESFFATFQPVLSLSEPKTLKGYAMPSALRPLGRTLRLCEIYAAVLGHLPRVTGEILPSIEDGSLGWDDYAKRTKPWALTIDLLMRVEERFVPLKDAKEKSR